jgi:hypothetical protein
MATSWDNRFAQRTQRMKGSVIRELLKFTRNLMSFHSQEECLHRTLFRSRNLPQPATTS